MPEVPHNADAILQAAADHADRVRDSLAAFIEDLSRNSARRKSLSEPARQEGLDLLAAAASAMAALSEKLKGDGGTRIPDEH